MGMYIVRRTRVDSTIACLGYCARPDLFCQDGSRYSSLVNIKWT